MMGKNLRYYRQLRRMSQEELARQLGVSAMAVSNYEKDKRQPDGATIASIAKALHVTIAQLVNQDSGGLAICHGAFRKHSSVGKQQQELILESADRYLGRLYNVISILGDTVLPPRLTYERKRVSDCEKAGQYLRVILGLAPNGPVGNIIDILENKGVIICPIPLDEPHFSGNSGTVNDRLYIALNANMPAERQRFTLIHELAHLVFIFDDNQNDEKMVDGVAGAFLLPQEDIIREMGPRRNDIRADLPYIQREYNVSMASIIVRAHQTGIISQATYEITQKWFSAQGLRKDEHSGICPEESHLLEQLTLRAVAEEEISISKAAELMDKPFYEVRRLCYGGV